jgi:hypothetical protein
MNERSPRRGFASALPRIAGILDQFIVEQPYDEHERSWHPKIA